jgi:hypothetical protein
MKTFGLADFKFSFYRIAIIALPVIFSLQCRISPNAGAGADPQDFLPLDNDISGFVKKGSASLMTDQQSIFNAIDGQAQKYIDEGFEEGVEQLYSNGSIDIDVRIFNQGTPANALTLFNYFMPTSSQTLSRSDPLVVVDQSLATSYSIQYTKQNIYMQITTTEKSDFALDMGEQFYFNVDKKIGAQ